MSLSKLHGTPDDEATEQGCDNFPIILTAMMGWSIHAGAVYEELNFRQVGPRYVHLAEIRQRLTPG